MGHSQIMESPEYDPQLLRCVKSADRGRGMIRLIGELDRTGDGVLGDALSRLWGAAFDVITVDLRLLTFLDAGGLRAIVLAQQTASARGVWLSVQCRPGIIARLVELVGLEQQMELEIPGPVQRPKLTLVQT